MIINPASGNGRALKEWDTIECLLQKMNVLFSHTFSRHKGHIVEIVKDQINSGYKQFIVVGGDGSISECINGIFSQTTVSTREISVAVIPAGSGNDFCRMHDISKSIEKAIDLIVNGKTVAHDVGRIVLENGAIHHFINIAGCGYDGFVAERVNRLYSKNKGNKAFYLVKVVQYLFTYQPVEIKISVHGIEYYNGKIFSIAIANCSFNGGGMNQAPEAKFDDGLLNLTLIEPRPLFKIIFNLYRLFTGTITEHEMVKSARVSSLEVKAGRNSFIEADGESLGAGNFEVKILPHAINIYSGLV